MRSMVLTLVFMITITSWAQSRRRRLPGQNPNHTRTGLKVKVLKLANRISKLAPKNVDMLTRAELIAVKTALKTAKQILKLGVGGQPSGGHGPIGSGQVACVNDYNTNLYHQAFAGIKAMANNELNKWGSNAVQYAKNWTEKYPCHYAAEFEDKISSLKDFAENKLNKWGSNAVNFAQENVDQLCLDQDYNSIFDRHKSFAQNQLNMWGSNAINYAFNQIKFQMLGCPVSVY